MTTSFISHRSSDGERLHAVLSLTVLRSLTKDDELEALRSIGINSISDLLHYDPIHRARLILAVTKGQIAHDMDLRSLVQDDVATNSPLELANAPTIIIDDIGETSAKPDMSD